MQLRYIALKSSSQLGLSKIFTKKKRVSKKKNNTTSVLIFNRLSNKRTGGFPQPWPGTQSDDSLINQQLRNVLRKKKKKKEFKDIVRRRSPFDSINHSTKKCFTSCDWFFTRADFHTTSFFLSVYSAFYWLFKRPCSSGYIRLWRR